MLDSHFNFLQPIESVHAKSCVVNADFFLEIRHCSSEGVSVLLGFKRYVYHSILCPYLWLCKLQCLLTHPQFLEEDNPRHIFMKNQGRGREGVLSVYELSAYTILKFLFQSLGKMHTRDLIELPDYRKKGF